MRTIHAVTLCAALAVAWCRGAAAVPSAHAAANAYGGMTALAACELEASEVTSWDSEDGGWDPSATLLRVVRLSAFPSNTAAGVPGFEGAPPHTAADEDGTLREVPPPPRKVFRAAGSDVQVPTGADLLPCLTALLDAGASPAARHRTSNEGALDLAVAQGDAWLVGTLLSLGVDPNDRDRRGLTPLMYAAHHGAVGLPPLLTLLAHPSTQPNVAIPSHGVDALMVAAQANNSAAVAALLDAGASVRRGDKDGVTALGKAAALGHGGIVEALAAAGADPSAADKAGVPPLIAAIRQNATEGITALIRVGVDAVAPFVADGATPLLYATSLPATRPVILALLAAGADPNAPTVKGITPMTQAVKSCPAKIVMDLVKAGGDTEARLGGKTLLTLAVEGGRAGSVAALLALGANANAVSDSKWAMRPLHLAAMVGHLPTTKVLVKAGAHLTAADKAKHTALHWAAYNGHAEVAAFLMASGVHVDAENADGLTAVMLAAQQGHAPVLRALAGTGVAHGANLDIRESKLGRAPLHLAAALGHTEAVAALVGAGADVNATDSRLWTALALAARHNYRDTVLTLLQAGASVRVFYPDDTGLLPEDVVDTDSAELVGTDGFVPEDEQDTHLCLSLTLRAAHWDKSPEGRAAAADAKKGRKRRRRRKKDKKARKKKGKKGKKGGRDAKAERPATPWSVAVPVCLAEFGGGAMRPHLPAVANAVCGFEGGDGVEPSPPCGVNSIRLPVAMTFVNPGGMLPRVADAHATRLSEWAFRYFGTHQHRRAAVVAGNGNAIIDTREVLEGLGVSVEHLNGRTPEEINRIVAEAEAGAAPRPVQVDWQEEQLEADAAAAEELATLGGFSPPGSGSAAAEEVEAAAEEAEAAPDAPAAEEEEAGLEELLA